MEYVFMIVACILFVIFVITLEGYRAQKKEKQFIADLYNKYEKLSEKKYALERFEKIRSFYERHRVDSQIDDITWNDLGMDDVFKRMNYTLSSTGEEYLYYKLRTLEKSEDELLHFERIVDSFGKHPESRVKFQYQMKCLGHTGKYSLYDYLDNLEFLGARSNRQHYFLDLLYLPLILLMFLHFSWGMIGVIVLTIYNIVSYFKEKAQIEPYIVSFAYLIRLLGVSKKIMGIPLEGCEEEVARIKDKFNLLKKMEHNSFLVIHQGNSSVASGDIISIFLDYIRMIFHADLIKFNNMLLFLREHINDVDELICTIGYMESAVATWIFRESLKNGWCSPELSYPLDEKKLNCVIPELVLDNGYHPLLDTPVKNSIHTSNGVLLTGSNASGKSTFLKMVAINAILAQSIYTCCADKYQANFFYVYSSMALKDNIESGESYYIVEIKALKRILDEALNKKPILCFVDEVLRGTNTVERIAASSQILRSLKESDILCFAATHDIELTDLLENIFDNYHFEEDVKDGDIVFQYAIKPGKATTRNAIKLLELMGYEPKIVTNAMNRAENFIQTGIWRKCFFLTWR